MFSRKILIMMDLISKINFVAFFNVEYKINYTRSYQVCLTYDIKLVVT